ncbi:single-stranded-DNA-specific exonuclease RecJ [Patescibacteria group bacterium]
MKWILKSKAPEEFAKKFPEYSSLIIQLLYDRGLKTQKQIDEFFNPDYEQDFHDPFLLKDMGKAVKRIRKAIRKKEKILILGDYDADGVCSSAILYLTLKHLGYKKPSIYIPDRDKEGHGLNKNAIKEIADNKVNLIITVDCGSRDIEEVDFAKSLGIDVIITDHHEVGSKLPNAVAVIDFHQNGDKYPFKYLAGAGVAYKLACALLPSGDIFKKWLLDLTAVATVADVMPIIGENRAIVLYGLSVLAQTKSIGLKELMNVSGVEPKIIQYSMNGEAPDTNLNTFTLGFTLGPRLNAASRMGHANTAFRLLVTKDKQEALDLAKLLNSKNTARQTLTNKIYKEIQERLDRLFIKNRTSKLIFEGSHNWPVGLVGLVASKVVDKYYCPAFIYCEKKDIIQASGRSIPSFDLIEAITKCSNYLERYGGHKGAAGFTLKKENIEHVKKILTKFVESKLRGKKLEKSLEIDAELFFDDISWVNYDQIQRFAPFGKDNSEPKFLMKGAEIIDLKIVGNGSKHLKLDLRIKNKEKNLAKNIKAIGFNLGEWKEKIKIGDIIDLVFEFTVNEWNGYRNLQMKIIDLDKS